MKKLYNLEAWIAASQKTLLAMTKNLTSKKPLSLLFTLIWMTILAIIAETNLFFIHFKASNLIDSLVQSSLSSQMFHSVILLPILIFILIQIVSYSLFIAWILFF